MFEIAESSVESLCRCSLVRTDAGMEKRSRHRYPGPKLKPADFDVITLTNQHAVLYQQILEGEWIPFCSFVQDVSANNVTLQRKTMLCC